MPCSKKLFLTGATGLIGKEILKPLSEAGFEVYALTIDENNPPLEHVNWIKGNLFDEAVLAESFEQIRPDYLLNMAWCTSGDYQTSNLNFDFVRAGLTLLKHFAKNGGKRAVFAGTCMEYAPKADALSENDLISPVTPYGVCKNALHQLADCFCRQNGISFAYGRIFYVYGRNEHPARLTASIINSLKAGKPVQINCSHLQRDYMYSKDIASAFTKLLCSDVQGAVNISTGKAIRLADYARTVAELLGRSDLLILKEENTNQPLLVEGNPSRLNNEVGFIPAYSLSEALKEIIL